MKLGIYYLSLLYAFIIPLSRAGIVATSMFLILLWIFEGRWSEKWNELKNCNIFIAIMVFFSYNLISLLWTDLLLESIIYISKYWYFLPIFVIFTSFPKEKSREILTFFIAGMLISEILSYGIFFEFWTINHGSHEDPTPFMNHLDYSIFLAFTSLVLYIKLLHAKDLKEKVLYLLFFLTVSSNLFITAGRSGQLAFFITLAIILFIYLKKDILKSLFATIITSVLVLITPMLLSDTFKDRVFQAVFDIKMVSSDQDYTSSLGNRFGSWEVASDILKKNFFIGLGNQDNITALQKITTEKKHLYPLNWYPHFHNQYLDIITSLGFLGLLVLLNIFFKIYKTRSKTEPEYLIKIAFTTIFLVGFIAEPFLHKQFTMALFALILGYILLNHKSSKEKIDDSF